MVTALAVGLLFTVAGVRYRDVPYAIPFVIQIWLFASPVFYSINSLETNYQWLAALNPMTGAITGSALGAARHATARACGRGERCDGTCPPRRRPGRLPQRRAALRGHDLMAAAATIEVDGLGKRYRIGQLQSGYGTLRDSLAHAGRRLLGREHKQHYEEIWAVKDVSFSVNQGEVLGIIGRNGAGKSTLLKLLTQITTPTTGQAVIRGRIGSLLEVGTGFHPELTGRENIYLNGAILGMGRREITKKLPEIVDFAGVATFLDTPVKRYSSGMYVRLAFSVAAHLEPEILLVDEVLSVGDAEFQRRSLGRMEEFSRPAAPSSSSPTRCRRSLGSVTARSCSTAARWFATARATRSSRSTCSR